MTSHAEGSGNTCILLPNCTLTSCCCLSAWPGSSAQWAGVSYYSQQKLLSSKPLEMWRQDPAPCLGELAAAPGATSRPFGLHLCSAPKGKGGGCWFAPRSSLHLCWVRAGSGLFPRQLSLQAWWKVILGVLM